MKRVDMFRRVWDALRSSGSPGLWWGGACMALLTVLMGMALLGLSGWFITATALAGLVPATALVFDVFMPSAGIRLLALGRTGARYAERLVTHDATLAALAALRERLLRAWSAPQAARSLMRRPARLLQRLTADVDALDNLYLRLLVPAFAALGAALLLMLAFGFMRWWMGLLAGVWLLVCGWGIALHHAMRSRKTVVRRALHIENMRAQTVDLVAGKTELLMAQRLDAQRAAVLRSDARAAHADRQLYRAEARTTMAYGVASAVTLSASLLAMAWLVEQQRIGAAVAAMGVLLALSAMEPFAALRRGATEAGRTWLAVRRIGAALAGEERMATRLPVPVHTAAAVELQQAVAAHSGHVVTSPIDLQIRMGERVALIGTSGAGKSSLLSLIAGELPPASGLVHAVASSWMTQRTELFRDSLRDNLRVANPHASDEDLWRVLEAAGLASDVRALPRALDTPLGEGGLGLSGGQSRRLALARLLLTSTPLWLLDEVSEGLDGALARDVLARLLDASGERTLVLATHWRREAALADRVIWMEQGRIVGQALHGTPEFMKALARLRADAEADTGTSAPDSF